MINLSLKTFYLANIIKLNMTRDIKKNMIQKIAIKGMFDVCSSKMPNV